MEFHFEYSIPKLRSENKFLAIVPRVNRVRSGGRLFSAIAAKCWNQLPDHIRLEPNHLWFQKLLKTLLFP